MDEPRVTSAELATNRAAAYWAPLGLVVLVAMIFGARLTTLPVRGEESRWARVAVQMLETNDWLVPRQQGKPYIDRPPLAQWVIAFVGMVAGQVGLLAIRLPSVLSVLATSLLIYFYGRTFLEPLGAFAAGLVYATFGQVLQIGRLGENEALYTLLAGGSLLVWHAGYQSNRSRVWPWVLGYSMVAGAALIKGPQAPVYFVAATGLFLLIRRDWRWLFGWQQCMGWFSFAAVFSLWQIPFLWETGWDTSLGMWTRTSAYRYSSHGFLEHLATYPLETFACLLPWSPLLLSLVRPGVRRQLGDFPQHCLFLIVALAITYPSVWFAAGARGRYFMPLYPCFALLIGFVIERSVAAATGTAARKGWELFLSVLAVVIAISGPGLLLVTLVPTLGNLGQPVLFAVPFAVSSLVIAAILWRLRVNAGPRAAYTALTGLAIFLGMAYTGAVINARLRRANDMSQPVALLKASLPPNAKLVSFGAIDHRFAYYFENFIDELDWPSDCAAVPERLEFFCYTHREGDTPERRRNGRGMYWETTPGTLPFAWEEVARLPCDRNVRDPAQVTVVVGRILQPIAAAPTSTTQR